MSNFTLLAIPTFVFMGAMLQTSGIAERLLQAMGQLLGQLRGGLALAVVLVGSLMAATTGVTAATVTTMGLISLPAMLQAGYNKSFASGVIVASGTLGQLIPPSIVLVVLGWMCRDKEDGSGMVVRMQCPVTRGSSIMIFENSATALVAIDLFDLFLYILARGVGGSMMVRMIFRISEFIILSF